MVARAKAETQCQGLTLETLIWTRGGGSGKKWEDLEYIFGVEQRVLPTFLQNWMELQRHLLKWVQLMENSFKGKKSGVQVCTC